MDSEYQIKLNNALCKLGQAMEFGGRLGGEYVDVINEAADLIAKFRSRELVVANCAKAIQLLAKGEIDWVLASKILRDVSDHLKESIDWLNRRDEAMAAMVSGPYEVAIQNLKAELSLYQVKSKGKVQ